LNADLCSAGGQKDAEEGKPANGPE
jgi:hypothetical protein